ncbi:cytochrome c [Methylocystis sp.]|uniref:c-type cytochrome n=1 Tax=Methylocystis sp. TaxID=1911079 RepID=UPI0025EA9145|nr:cytochrome c [Methylocystis sp.]
MRIIIHLPICFLCLLYASGGHAGDLSDVIVQCAACHGADGIAKSADVPHLAGQHELYLFNQIKAFRSGRRPHEEMRYMSRQLSEAEMREIARHYAAMPR